MSGVIVGLDTATSASSVAVLAGGELTERRSDPEPGARPGHSSELFGLLSAALDASGASYSDITKVAVGIGPGTFTGIRIGLSMAKGLALATGAELVGVGSLRALLAGAGAVLPTVAMIDARRGEVFVASSNGAHVAARPIAVPLLEAAPLLAPGSLCVGDGALLIRDDLVAHGMDVPDSGDSRHMVSAGQIVLLSADPDRRGDDVLPDYVRDPDAVPTSER